MRTTPWPVAGVPPSPAQAARSPGTAQERTSPATTRARRASHALRRARAGAPCARAPGVHASRAVRSSRRRMLRRDLIAPRVHRARRQSASVVAATGACGGRDRRVRRPRTAAHDRAAPRARAAAVPSNGSGAVRAGPRASRGAVEQGDTDGRERDDDRLAAPRSAPGRQPGAARGRVAWRDAHPRRRVARDGRASDGGRPRRRRALVARALTRGARRRPAPPRIGTGGAARRAGNGARRPRGGDGRAPRGVGRGHRLDAARRGRRRRGRPARPGRRDRRRARREPARGARCGRDRTGLTLSGLHPVLARRQPRAAASRAAARAGHSGRRAGLGLAAASREPQYCCACACGRQAMERCLRR